MEIYTTDLIEIALRRASIIEDQINYRGYVIQDECCNLKRDICSTLYQRLSDAFKYLIDESKTREVDWDNELYKIINDL